MSLQPRFPKMPDTIRAEVLAVLLASEDMTGFESIFARRKACLPLLWYFFLNRLSEVAGAIRGKKS